MTPQDTDGQENGYLAHEERLYGDVQLDSPAANNPVVTTGSIDSQVYQPQGPKTLLRFNKVALIATSSAIALVLIIGLVVLGKAGFKANDQQANASQQNADSFGVSNVNVSGLQQNQILSVTQASKLNINGELQVGNTIVLTPTSTPTTPKLGQIYYNKDNNTAYMFNGSAFVSISGGVTSIGGSSGDIGLGNGLSLADGQLAISGQLVSALQNLQQIPSSFVSSLQGRTGSVTLSSGNGIGVNGTTITNTGVISLQSGSSAITVSNNNGAYTISLGGGSITGSGAANTIPLFTASGAIGNSLLTQSGGTVSLNGDLQVAGGLSSTATGDFNISAGSQQLVFTSGNQTFQFPGNVSGPNQLICLVGMDCSSGDGGSFVVLGPSAVQDYSGTNAAIFVNQSGSGSALRVQSLGLDRLVVANNGDVSASANLTVGGTINGAQISGGNISGGTVNGATISGGSLTGGSLTSTTVNNLGLTSSQITASGALTVSTAANQNLSLNTNGTGVIVLGTSQLQGTGALSISAGGLNQNVTIAGTGTGTVVIQTPVFRNANGATYSFDASDAGSVVATICTSAGNCNGSGGSAVVSTGTSNYIALYGSDGYHLGNSLLSQDAGATKVTIAGALQAGQVTGTSFSGNGSALTNVDAEKLGGQLGSYYRNASNINDGTIGDTYLSANVTRMGNTFNGASQLVRLDSAGLLPALNGSALTNLNASALTTGTVADALLTGNVAKYNDTSADFSGTLKNNGYAVCTTVGNCIGSGSGGAVGGSGSTNKIAMFTGASTLGDSLLTQSTGLITNSGAFAIQGAAGLALGVASTTNGIVTFNNATGSHTVSLQAPTSDPASNLVFKLPSSYGSDGSCLLSDGVGGMTFSSCTGGAGGGVTSIKNLTGNVGLNNSSVSGNNIVIDDAKADGATKGIATFSSSQFSGTGTISLKAGGITGTELATGTVANTNLANSSITVSAGTNLGGGGTVSLGGSITLNVASSPVFSGTLTVQGASTTVGTNALQGNLVLHSGNGNAGTLRTAANLGQATTYILPDVGTASATVCLSTGNCVGTGTGGGIGGGGTVNKIALFTGTGFTVGDSILTQSGTTGVAIAGQLSATGAVTFSNYTSAGVLHNSASGVLTSSQIVDADLQAGTFSNITGTGNLSVGNIVNGFGSITTANNITGATINATSGIRTGGTDRLSAAGALQNITGYSQTSGNFAMDGGNFSQTGSGTFSTGVGAVSLNGATTATSLTVSNSTALQGNVAISNGFQFTNASSTLNTALSLGNFATGGSIGTATATVDTRTSIAIAQSTAGQTLTLPTPTDTTAGRVMYVLNTGSVAFTMSGITVPAGYGQIFIWNGSSWILGANGGGSSISLQSAYSGGNTINTSNATNISFTLADTATDANFLVNVASGSTGQFKVQNNGTDVLTVGSAGQLGLTVQGASGGLNIGTDTLLYRSGANRAQMNNALVLQNTTDTTTAFQVKNAAGTTNVLTVDTSNSAFTIQGGTGTGAISLQSGAGATILIGTTAAATVTIGNASGTVALQGTVNITNGLYLGGTTAAQLRISSSGALSNISIPTGSSVTLGTGNALGVAYVNSSNVLQIAAASGSATYTKCLMSDGTSNIGFGTCPGGGGGGWNLTGTNAAGSILGVTGTNGNYGNFVISSAPNGNSAGANSSNSYISFSGNPYGSPNVIVISGNSNSNSPQGGGAHDNAKDIIRIQDSQGDVLFAGQGYNGSIQAFLYTIAGSNVGANTRVCTTIGVGASGLGTIATCPSGVDLAEAYNSTQALEPGDIVAVDKDNYPNVVRTDVAAQDSLVGIVSTKPNEVMGTDITPNGYPIALNGRVPTKVNAEGGVIHPGDKITSSSVPGVGKKATGAGMVVGTALTGYSGSGQGTIEVFVNPGYYEPTNTDTLQSQTATFGDLNVSGAATINNLTVTGLASVKNIRISGHIITASGQPTTEAQTAAGAGATTVVSGTDTTGTITITTGSAPTAGALAKLLFSELYTQAPHVVLSPSNEHAANSGFFKGATTTDGFSLNFKNAPEPNTTYTFDYFIAQ